MVWGNGIGALYGVRGSVRYSCLEGEPVWPGEGNISADPLFVSAGDYRLLPGSPCIDTGTSEEAPESDIEGNSRVDDPATPNSGVGTPDYVDMGAYEYQP